MSNEDSICSHLLGSILHLVLVLFIGVHMGHKNSIFCYLFCCIFHLVVVLLIHQHLLVQDLVQIFLTQGRNFLRHHFAASNLLNALLFTDAFLWRRGVGIYHVKLRYQTLFVIIWLVFQLICNINLLNLRVFGVNLIDPDFISWLFLFNFLISPILFPFLFLFNSAFLSLLHLLNHLPNFLNLFLFSLYPLAKVLEPIVDKLDLNPHKFLVALEQIDL